MPKMTHPNVERPLSVLPEDVEARKAAGWVEVNPQAAPSVPAAEPKTAAKKAVTRKSVKKS